MDSSSNRPTDERPRAGWMTLLAGLCALTLVVSIVRDLFLPASREVEVWFGFEVYGTAAMLTAPIHWAIFATGAWAFQNAKPWAAPAAAGYVFYAALAHLVWSEASPHGRGIAIGVVQAVAISTIGLLILRAHRSHTAQR